MSAESSVYSFFDDIVCINMINRPDRREYASGVFEKYKIPARFYGASRHPKGGMYGCFDSHIQVVKEAYESGKETLFVFEDDVLPTSGYSEEKVADAVRFMKENKDWDIFYFGYLPFNHSRKQFFMLSKTVENYPHIVKFNPYCTQSLCYNRQGMKKILDTYESYIGLKHYDVYISFWSNCNCYCYTPMLFDQLYDSPSNNDGFTVIEHATRALSPVAQRIELLYWITHIKCHIKKYITGTIVGSAIAYSMYGALKQTKTDKRNAYGA
jgi:hypothetical protein